MKHLALAILAALTVAAHAAVRQLSLIDDALKVEGLVSAAKRRTMQMAVQDAGCFANTCFAIDGSGSINDQAFTNEKRFIMDLHSIIGVDERSDMGAVQFSTSTRPISPVTKDREAFNLAVNRAKQLGGLSFVVGGINYCFRQLFRKRVKKIVLLSDGRSNIGADAVQRADLFRSLGGTVCTVAAGSPDDKKLLAISGGDPDLVFKVTKFLDTFALADIVDNLVAQICDIPIQKLQVRRRRSIL